MLFCSLTYCKIKKGAEVKTGYLFYFHLFKTKHGLVKYIQDNKD